MEMILFHYTMRLLGHFRETPCCVFQLSGQINLGSGGVNIITYLNIERRNYNERNRVIGNYGSEMY